MRKVRALKILFLITSFFILVGNLHAKEIEYKGGEIEIIAAPGQPTEIQFPDTIKTGYRKKLSALSIEKRDNKLIVFPKDSLSPEGESILVHIKSGRSYAIKIKRATGGQKRDAIVKIIDSRVSVLPEEEEVSPFKERAFKYAPPSTVSGLMRELILATEFGKVKIPGYKVSDRFKGEVVLNDGALKVTIDKIFVGPTLWGYVLDAENQLDVSQRINPATFRLDGTRAVSATNWELAPRPMNIEQQIAKKHTTKVYVITKANKNR